MTYGIGIGMANGIPQSGGTYTETRTYNNMYQMTNLTVSGVLNMTYTYSATQNNGQVSTAFMNPTAPTPGAPGYTMGPCYNRNSASPL